MENTKTEQKKKQVKNPLKDERVLIKPVIWANRLFHGEHSGNWQYDDTTLTATVRIDGGTGLLREPLTKEEKEFFEDPTRTHEHGLSFNPGDLSARKQKDNFWQNYEFKIRKHNDGAVKEDQTILTLDLSKTEDFFMYKVLMTNSGPKGFVAEGWDNRYSRGTNKLVLVRENERYADKLTRANKLETANKFFYGINHSSDKMYDFLNVFYLENKDYKQPATDGGNDYYKSEMQELIDTRIDDVLSIISNEDDYQMKIMVHRALREGILQFDGRTGIDDTATGKPLGNTLSQVIKFLKDDRNQKFLLKIKAQLDKDKGTTKDD